MPREAVLDASAILALVHAEPGASRVALTIPGAWVSAVNLSEAATKLAAAGISEEALRSALGGLGLRVVPFDEALAYTAGLLRPTAQASGLSLGDRACLALALRSKLPALTTDRAWAGLDMGAEVEVIR